MRDEDLANVATVSAGGNEVVSVPPCHTQDVVRLCAAPRRAWDSSCKPCQGALLPVAATPRGAGACKNDMQLCSHDNVSNIEAGGWQLLSAASPYVAGI